MVCIKKARRLSESRKEARCCWPCPKLCSDVVALGFEHIVVLVLNLPAGAAVQGNSFDVGLPDFEIGDESVLIELLG